VLSEDNWIGQRKGLDKEMSLRQYSLCVDEIEKETEEIAEIIFACKKSPYRTGLSSRVGLERRPFPAQCHKRGFMETKAVPRRADMLTEAAPS